MLLTKHKPAQPWSKEDRYTFGILASFLNRARKIVIIVHKIIESCPTQKQSEIKRLQYISKR